MLFATQHFNVTTGVKQKFIFSLFLFILAIDWVLKHLTSVEEEGFDGHWPVSWKTWIMLMIVCCSTSDSKTYRQSLINALGLKISRRKSGYFRMDSRTIHWSIMLNGDVVDEVDHFTYLELRSPPAEMEKSRSRFGFQRQARPSPCFGVLGDPR